MRQPRLLIGAASSGSGKTLLTCGILQALKDRGMKVSSFKCGPDYIDPMFHSKVLKTRSANLDLYFTNPGLTRHLFEKTAKGTDISVIEGVMGYYDGLGGVSTEASTYDLAVVTDTPVVLIINCRGMSISVAALIKGFQEYREDSHIKGVILNQMSGMLYPRIKQQIEKETKVRVYGYVPKVTDCLIESRHLGLVMPDEVENLERKLKDLAELLGRTLDLDGLTALAESAPPIRGAAPQIKILDGEPVVAVAYDEAFCFIYQENLRLLKEMGARIVCFSPLHDSGIPVEAEGLLLYGGYPELFAKELSENESMLGDISGRLRQGMPCMAECGGFMYLHDQMEDMDGNSYRMAGVVEGKAYRTEKLGRFGYIELSGRNEKPDEADAQTIRAHEFHYFDSTDPGDCFLARKPSGGRQWGCIHENGGLMAGFPHLYYYSNPQVPYRFLEKCLSFRKKTGAKNKLVSTLDGGKRG